MTYKFLDMLTTPAVRDAQSDNGVREFWANIGADRTFDRFDENTASFISARDSFYIASISQSGWPYLQHRGGPVGFVKVLDDKTLGFADYSGNRQYISLGNTYADDRVALFMVDYPRRKRLKLLCHMKTHKLDEDVALTEKVWDRDYIGKPERVTTLSLEAFDWNCPQHLVPRFTQEMIDHAAKPLQDEIARLTAENEKLRANTRPL